MRASRGPTAAVQPAAVRREASPTRRPRSGATEEVALDRVDTEQLQGVELGCGLDALADHQAARLERVEDQRADHRPARVVVVDAGDQGAVDLDDVRADRDDVPEGRVAGPRVVDGQPDAVQSQRLAGAEQRRVVVNGGVLGQLDHDPGRGEAGAEQRGQQAGAQQCRGGGVDGDVEVVGQVCRGHHVGLDRQQLELHPTPDPVREGEPDVGRSGRVRSEPGQRLDTHDLAGRHVHDRLERAVHETAGDDLLGQHRGPSALHHLAHRAAQDPGQDAELDGGEEQRERCRQVDERAAGCPGPVGVESR